MSNNNNLDFLYDPCHNLSDDVFNYDVDDLKGLVDANLKERQMAAEAISNEISHCFFT
jgi:glutamyl-tRNA reductase